VTPGHVLDGIRGFHGTVAQRLAAVASSEGDLAANCWLGQFCFF